MKAVIVANVEITIDNARTLPDGDGVRTFEEQIEDLISLPGLVESKATITSMVLE